MASRTKTLANSDAVKPPANWERVIEGICRMGSLEHAPVDSIDPDEGVTSLQPKVHTSL